ncbi:MAG: AAA family ATPase [Desulfobacterales bacterium]|nr:AAA family ATPase [Desulfobacterales bacterium]
MKTTAKELKNVLSISKVLEHYSVKKGKGKNSYHCPLHDDKNPSLVASDEKQTASCLSQECFKNDDIFTFIMKMESCDFNKALEIAQNIAGISGITNIKLTKIPTMTQIKPIHIQFLKNRGINNIEEIIKFYNLKAWKDYISTDINKETFKFIPINKALKTFTLGKKRSAQIYKSINTLSVNTALNILVVAGEKDTWRVHDSLITELKNNKINDNFVIVSNTAGEGNIPSYFFDEFKNMNISNIYICYDNDKTGKEGNLKVYELAKSIFSEKTNITILLFDENKPQKYDLTDFLNEGNSFSDIFSKLTPYQPKHKEFLNGDFFIALDLIGKPPLIQWIVKDFLPQNIVGAIVATGSTGKSWFLLQLATCISAGIKFMGMETTEPSKVLYINGEEVRDDIHRRLFNIRNHYQNNDHNFKKNEEILNQNLSFLCVNGTNATLKQNEGLFIELQKYILSIRLNFSKIFNFVVF